jgi:hypothetical protein
MMKRSLFETNKIIPSKYHDVILEVLEAYPELQGICIRFCLKDKHPVPYGTTPDLSSVLRKPERRSYTVTIREKATGPTEQVLFRNLTHEMQKGVIAHELIHVLQYQSRSGIGVLKLICGMVKSSVQRQMEQEADRGAVERGFGRELHAHAVHMRSVPGYPQMRPAVHRNYMEPEEILDYMQALKK